MAEQKRKIFSNIGIPLDFVNFMVLVVLTLVFVQAIGLILGTWGAHIKLGPIFVLLAIGFAALMGVALFRKVAYDHVGVTKQDIFAVLVSVGVALLIMFLLRDFVPEIFSPGLMQIQSMLGF